MTSNVINGWSWPGIANYLEEKQLQRTAKERGNLRTGSVYLFNQLNAIAHGSIGDEAHISMMLTQIGIENSVLKRNRL